MIDQCKIAVVPDRIQVKPELVNDPQHLLDDWFLPIRARRESDTKKSRKDCYPAYHSRFQLFADHSLTVHTRSEDRPDTDRSRQCIYLIEVNLRKLLYGHNGISIRDGEDLCHGLMLARHVLKQMLADPEQASDLIPGLRGNTTSYWRALEIALDVRDPGLVIRRRMELMRSPYVRRKPDHYENTTSLKGRHVEIKAYDKIAQMMDKHKVRKNKVAAGNDPVTRLEVTILKGNCADFSRLDPAMVPRITGIGVREDPQITGFIWEQLRAIHRHYLSCLRAVYNRPAAKGCLPEHSYAAVLAAIAREHDIPPQSIYDALASYSGKGASTLSSIRRQMEWHIGQSSELTAEELLSDEAYRNPPTVAVGGLDGPRFYVSRYGWQEIRESEAEVSEIYGPSRSASATLPQLAKSYLLW